MVKMQSKQRVVSLVMLAFVAIVWGAGFVLADQLLTEGFFAVPGLQNALRFCIGTIVLLILLRKHINFGGKNMLYGGVGGALLFVGFLLQLEGQNHITPAHCGLFTALYFVLTPFVTWIAYKKAPSFAVFVAIVVAICGTVILNMGQLPTKEEILGMVMTVGGALLFSIQIVWSDYLLKENKIDSNSLVVIQLIVASLLFVCYTLIFESKHYSSLNINFSSVWWKVAIVAVLGTGFAYFAQTFAQKHVSPSQTSLILACESPIGAVISIVIGIDAFSWNIVVGGLLILAAVVIIEVVPIWLEKRKARLIQRENAKVNQQQLDEENSHLTTDVEG